MAMASCVVVPAMIMCWVVFRRVIVSRMGIVAVSSMIMLSFKPGFVQPILPDMGSMTIHQTDRRPILTTDSRVDVTTMIVRFDFASDQLVSLF